MSRIGAIVRRLYGQELKPPAPKAAAPRAVRWRGVRRRAAALKKALTNRRTVVWVIRVVVALAAMGLVAEAIYQYNLLTSWHTLAEARRADVDLQLQRRENLIPNLVYAVGKYAAYEQAVFKYVSDARETLKTMRSPDTSRTKAGGELEKILSSLIALAEEYPDLKAAQPIQDLIREAADTENRVADAKREYNKTCATYNQYRSTFPGNVFAFVYRFGALPFIGLEEDVSVPAIDLKMPERGDAPLLKNDLKDE